MICDVYATLICVLLDKGDRSKSRVVGDPSNRSPFVLLFFPFYDSQYAFELLFVIGVLCCNQSVVKMNFPET
jgi:hypothetical protein